MTDTGEAERLNRRMAYIDALRGLHRKERLVGFLMILVGAAMVLPARFVAGWPDAAIWANRCGSANAMRARKGRRRAWISTSNGRRAT